MAKSECFEIIHWSAAYTAWSQALYILEDDLLSLQAKPLNEGIANFYDESTPLWESMWGEHLHHGYYGKQDKPKSNAQAQVDMIEEVLKWADVKKVSQVLFCTLHWGIEKQWYP